VYRLEERGNVEALGSGPILVRAEVEIVDCEGAKRSRMASIILCKVRGSSVGSRDVGALPSSNSPSSRTTLRALERGDARRHDP